jgi:hypothetical protein
LGPGNIRAGTPIAVMPAGTLSMTSGFATMHAASPIHRADYGRIAGNEYVITDDGTASLSTDGASMKD